MIIELTQDQQQALEQAGGSPPQVINPRTRETYVLLRTEVYERMERMLQEGFDPREAYAFVDKIMAEDDAEDPHLESYQHFTRGKGA